MRKIMLILVMVCLVSSGVLAANVDPALEGAKDKVDVIVTMMPGANHLDITNFGGEMKKSYEIINGFAATIPAKAIKALSNNPNVKNIAKDKIVKVNLNVAVCAVNADDLWAYGYDGTGVTIAIIDTGLEASHPDFQGRVTGWYDAVNGRSTPYDDHYHGTHVAGIAAGNGPTYKGPAKDANLWGIKVLNSQGSGTTSDIIDGINVAYQNGVDVINISLGGTVTQSSTNDPLCEAVRNAWASGSVVVVAAGNSGPNYYTIGSPGNEPDVITVGAVDDNGTCSISDDTIADFSSRGPTDIDYWVKPDVAAPGVKITATDSDGSGYRTLSGTSMATPIVSGVVAQLLEAHPSWSNNTIKSALMNTAQDIMDHQYEQYIQGRGMIDAWAAYNY